jgi:hypothetical protein
MINMKIAKKANMIKIAMYISPNTLALPAKVNIRESLVIENGIKNKIKPLRIIFTERVSSSAFIFNCVINIPFINPIIMPTIRVKAIWIMGLIPGNNKLQSNIATPGANAKVDSIERSRWPDIRTIPCPNTKSPKAELW